MFWVPNGLSNRTPAGVDNSALSVGQLLVHLVRAGDAPVAADVLGAPTVRGEPLLDEGARIVDVIDVDDNHVVVRVVSVVVLVVSLRLLCAASSLPCPASHLCVLGEGSGRLDHGHEPVTIGVGYCSHK